MLLPYFFSSLMLILLTRSALTSILGSSRELPGTSTAKTRCPLNQHQSSRLPFACHSLSGLSPFQINALKQTRQAGGLPSETPDLPSLPTSLLFSLWLADHRFRPASFLLARCSKSEAKRS